jgi:hypothetical protein
MVRYRPFSLRLAARRGPQRGPVLQEPSIRCTVVDAAGTTTFVGPGHLIKVLTAACAKGPTDLRALFQHAERYDPDLIRDLSSGLRIFDEHNTPDQHEHIDERLAEQPDYPLPIRAIDARTRQLTLEPVGAGLVVFNLNAKRIVQVQNSYAEVLRQDRGRIRAGGEATETIFHYRLPADWTITP